VDEGSVRRRGIHGAIDERWVCEEKGDPRKEDGVKV